MQSFKIYQRLPSKSFLPHFIPVNVSSKQTTRSSAWHWNETRLLLISVSLALSDVQELMLHLCFQVVSARTKPSHPLSGLAVLWWILGQKIQPAAWYLLTHRKVWKRESLSFLFIAIATMMEALQGMYLYAWPYGLNMNYDEKTVTNETSLISCCWMILWNIAFDVTLGHFVSGTWEQWTVVYYSFMCDLLLKVQNHICL